jgi:hypothetical protein
MDLITSVRQTIGDIDFPASKEQLVAHVEGKPHDEEALRAVRALPLADYRNENEVLRSLHLDPAEREGQTAEDKANQARQRGKSGLAEHMRDAPRSPIEEELGENRKR